jgi:uncharacterized protein with GYD domain
MPTFILLMNYTEDGIKNIKTVGTRTETMNKGVTSLGGKVISHYGTMGQYDRISIIEMPDDNAMALLALRLNSSGVVRTNTIKAYPIEEFIKIINKLPAA